MMDNSYELMACPRCRIIDCKIYTVGDDDDDEGGDAYVVCKCGLTGTLCSNQDESVEWWNTRATDPLLVEMADSLKSLIERATNFGYGFAMGNEMADAEQVLQRYHEHHG